MNASRLFPVATLALATVALSGCGSTTEEPPAADRTTIAELMGQDTFYSDEEYRANDERIQELVAGCMAEKGWEYIPVSYPDTSYVPSDEDELTRRQREGYGIAYWALNRGNEDLGRPDPGTDWVDPNAAYVESLTESERTAYNQDLYGDAMLYAASKPATTPGTDVILPSPGTVFDAGCQGEASAEVYGEPVSHSEEYWNSMNAFYEELTARVEADPRFKQLDTTWAACMRGGGYDYATPNDIWTTAYADLQARHDDIVGDLFSQDPFEGWSQEEIDAFFASATQEQIDAKFNDLYVLTDDQRTALEGLLADETALAVVEYGCSKPYNDNYQEISAQIEEEYALEHRAEIEALVASEPG